MKIQAINIKKLFDIFDYDIKFPQKENVLIITGPNGYGKTQVLNILFNLFNRRLIFFQQLVFEEITIIFEKTISVTIQKEVSKGSEKKKERETTRVFIAFYEGTSKLETLVYPDVIDGNLTKHISGFLPLSRIDENQWIDHRTDRLLSLDEVLFEFGDQLPAEIGRQFLKFKSQKVNDIIDSVNVHLIREQRLFKKVNNSDRTARGQRDQTVMIETIQTYANELKKLITERSQQSYIISQTLDSSYPTRLISEKSKVSNEEYDRRFSLVTEKQEKLMRNGLYESNQKVLAYSQDDAKALLVYLNDLEQKLVVFDDLLEKLELFTKILNERRFTFKSINIDREKGFYFKTRNGKELNLSQLSSGEQHEVVLLYELIFNTKPNIIVLIDEPEISLHITWQKDFLDDLLRIIKIQNFQVLIATHSPSIINDRWDLVYNLEKNDS
jgi:predicted ATP-binding protein involved in virulence